jgi:hypothetical protein
MATRYGARSRPLTQVTPPQRRGRISKQESSTTEYTDYTDRGPKHEDILTEYGSGLTRMARETPGSADVSSASLSSPMPGPLTDREGSRFLRLWGSLCFGYRRSGCRRDASVPRGVNAPSWERWRLAGFPLLCPFRVNPVPSAVTILGFHSAVLPSPNCGSMTQHPRSGVPPA